MVHDPAHCGLESLPLTSTAFLLLVICFWRFTLFVAIKGAWFGQKKMACLRSCRLQPALAGWLWGHEEKLQTSSSWYVVGSPISALLCGDLEIAFFVPVPGCAPIFSALWEPCQTNAPIRPPTSVLPIFLRYNCVRAASGSLTLNLVHSSLIDMGVTPSLFLLLLLPLNFLSIFFFC